MSHVTALGCTLRVYPADDHLGGLPSVMLVARMEQPGDGRWWEVLLNEQDRRWLAKELMLGLPAVWYMARCSLCDMAVPFMRDDERDEWADLHASIVDPFNSLLKHHVDIYEEAKR